MYNLKAFRKKSKQKNVVEGIRTRALRPAYNEPESADTFALNRFGSKKQVFFKAVNGYVFAHSCPVF